jgi:hypothetical protein
VATREGKVQRLCAVVNGGNLNVGNGGLQRIYDGRVFAVVVSRDKDIDWFIVTT